VFVGAAVEFGPWKLIAEITYLKIDPCYASLSIPTNMHIYAALLRFFSLSFWERAKERGGRGDIFSAICYSIIAVGAYFDVSYSLLPRHPA